ncbi:MAG TPA: metalloregulator ArsR/SmtB family transcription factor [Oligoflexia bacterium]|nr:metalloregulator ArsR/SmtB family transcription factor [Oligoflexia bacterium]
MSKQRKFEKVRVFYEKRATILKALAHPVRLFIIDELAKKEKCVCELRDLVGSDISTVSKHLLLLKNAGLVKDRKQGLQVFYSLQVSCVLKFFDCVEAVIGAEQQRYQATRRKAA